MATVQHQASNGDLQGVALHPLAAALLEPSSPRHRRQRGLSVLLKTRYVQILNATLGLRQRFAQND